MELAPDSSTAAAPSSTERPRSRGWVATARICPCRRSEEPKVLLSEARIAERVAELAEEISRDYAGVEEIILVGVLRGAFIFLADLARRLTVPRRVDFIALSSYEGESTSTTSGAVRLILDVRTPLEGQHVLVVEDIVDTGYTLEYLLKVLKARGPASLKTCVLLEKPGPPESPDVGGLPGVLNPRRVGRRLRARLRGPVPNPSLHRGRGAGAH